MTAPLVWLLLSALALIAPPPTSVATWERKPLVVLTRPAQPVSGSPMTVVVGVVPKRARNVVVVADDQTARARKRPTGLWEADIVAPAAGPLSLHVRFTLDGTRYEAQGGIVLVAPESSSG
jgi:hypothetical protein